MLSFVEHEKKFYNLGPRLNGSMLFANSTIFIFGALCVNENFGYTKLEEYNVCLLTSVK